MFVKATMLLVWEMKRIQCGMQQIIYKTPSKLPEVTPADGNLFSIYRNIIENLIIENEKGVIKSLHNGLMPGVTSYCSKQQNESETALQRGGERDKKWHYVMVE